MYIVYARGGVDSRNYLQSAIIAKETAKQIALKRDCKLPNSGWDSRISKEYNWYLKCETIEDVKQIMAAYECEVKKLEQAQKAYANAMKALLKIS